MTDQDRAKADALLGHIEEALGELPDRSHQNSVVIKEIIEAVNGLRSILGVVRAH